MGIKLNGITKIALSLVLTLGLVVGIGLAPSVASASPTPTYCTSNTQRHCLQRLTVTVTTPTPTDNKVYFTFYNPNRQTVPRSIAVFHNGVEVFGDDDFLTPGQNPPLVYGPFEDGEWRFVVSSYGTEFANEEFVFGCDL